MLDFLAAAATYLIPFVLLLTLIVTVHELGHYWAARACGVKIERFSIGFGDAIFKRVDKHGVEWRLAWIPLGGYVKFAGDENAASVPDQNDLESMRASIRAREGAGAENRYFHFKPVGQRAFITAAGPFANFVLSTLIFAFLLSAIGEQRVPPKVQEVQAGSAAAEAGFRPGDLIVEIEGRPVDDMVDARRIIALRSGTPTDFVVERGGERVALHAEPRRQSVDDGLGGQQKVGVLGVLLGAEASEVETVRVSALEAIPAGVVRTWEVLETTLTYLGRVVTGKESGDQLGGPLRIAQTSGAVAQQATEASQGGPWWYALANQGLALLSLAAILSVGIGFLNLLPIPVLDGGHLLFYAYESVARRPLGAEIQAMGYRVGLALLLGLMLFVTWNDLQHLRVFQFLGGLFS